MQSRTRARIPARWLRAQRPWLWGADMRLRLSEGPMDGRVSSAGLRVATLPVLTAFAVARRRRAPPSQLPIPRWRRAYTSLHGVLAAGENNAASSPVLPTKIPWY